MNQHLATRLSGVDALRCPACGGALARHDDGLECTACERRFPVVDRVPILVDDQRSMFACRDVVAGKASTFNPARSRLKARIDRWLPPLGRNLRARENYLRLVRLLEQRSTDPDVLVLGGSILGQGMDVLVAHPRIRCVETDVCFGPRTQLVCDAHVLPFADGAFDAVVVQGVLQYVADPGQCVAEIHRVLKPGGWVYAETAFMQQVVHGAYDFTRFTYVGLRRLFREFNELHSGVVGGPAMALAWAIQSFLLACVRRSWLRSGVHAVTRLGLFWLPYLDRLLAERPAAYDAASGFFFLGSRSECALTDHELIGLHRGH